MGSSQSSADTKETFVIDSSGKIARVSRNKPKQEDQTSGGGYNNSTDKEGTSAELENNQPQNSQQESTTSSQSHMSTLNNMPQPSGPSDQLKLSELDDILNRMKAKYKPNSAEMAGKSKSVFENIENRLLHCYKVNKDHALKCATLSEEYRSYVEKQRAEILVKSAKA